MSLSHNLNDFDVWLTHAMKRLSPAQARKLQRAIGVYFRKRTQQTMKAQTDPEGNAWEARKVRPIFPPPERQGKNKKRRTHKPKPMMKGLVKAKRLQIRSYGSQLKIGWFNGRDAMIARQHQFGGSVRLHFGTAQYPARPLLGITEQDQAEIKQMIIAFLNGE
ncbi:phage virion morphogenesis protein [Histophilus somni]|uniref:phage virion morphogenesis protein n=1 Tax=Histophilus somni TaxID=731 RepID=UPI00201F9666|nr:phage virion morphogenesis protein [Histophilus somni]